MIQVEDRNDPDKILLKHAMPSSPQEAHLNVDSKKKTCQWMVRRDMARNQDQLVVLVAFKSHSDFERFQQMFNKTS